MLISLREAYRKFKAAYPFRSNAFCNFFKFVAYIMFIALTMHVCGYMLWPCPRNVFAMLTKFIFIIINKQVAIALASKSRYTCRVLI